MGAHQEAAAEVNPHYLNHLLACGARQELMARQDILVEGGACLLSQGSRIGPAARERLLLNRLTQPLEACVQFQHPVTGPQLAEQAQQLLETDELLAPLCPAGRGRPLPESLGRLELSPSVQALLTLLADQRRLPHALRVALLTLSQARRLLPGQVERHQQLALAALLHDVGELYLDPELLGQADTLAALQWRPIASHPLIAHRLLQRMEGAGPAVAAAVLDHHERLDGFGFPRGIAQGAFPLDHQVLAAAEWLAGLLEAGGSALLRASIAARLIPGEFHPALLGWVHQAAQAPQARNWEPAPLALGQVRVERLARALQQARTLLPWASQQQQRASATLSQLLDLHLARLRRLLAGFSSAGLDSLTPDALLHSVAEAQDAELQRDLQALVDEFCWRLQELEREALLHSSRLGAAEAAVLHRLLAQLNEPAQRAAA
ncbi:HD domain-containing phosphohydrolase [Inhella proteolytica]|uniref:HD domain-containing protein n=1 Tax=Inhella proteolytica TaxID=2795029 RepID=A0A931J4R4_9BURK|nr:HD domain-containing phosphohydrolase [Inhella proteolytica]MBH9579591.1 HD domain-containing protein [Inhella proteolytica]